MAAKFIVEQGSLAGKELVLEGADEWVIGRDPAQCQLVLEDATVSRRHVVVRRTPQGFSIETLALTNPIIVNDETIEESQLLNHGDTLRIADVLLRFYEEAPESVMQSDEEDEAELPEEQEQEEASVEHIENEEEEYDTIFGDEEALVGDLATAEVSFDPTQGRRYVLKVVAGPNSGAQIGLDEARDYLIGTDANSCDVTFHDISVSHHHARLHVDGQSGGFRIEDLESRNGTFIDGVQVEGGHELGTNEVVALGTSAFVIYDKEGESQTLVSPLMPTKEKLFQAPAPAPEPVSTPEEVKSAIEQLREEEEKSTGAVTRLIVLAIVCFILVVFGSLLANLFNPSSVDIARPDRQEALNNIMADYPSVRYTYDRSSGDLLLMGHLVSKNTEDELIFRLLELDVNPTRRIVIDELVVREQNEFLSSKYPGVTMSVPEPALFILNGFLRSRSQMENMMASLSTDFPYINLLQNNVVVEENVLDEIDTLLQDNRMNAVNVEFNNGEITLGGNVAFEQAEIMDGLVEEIAKIPGVSLVRNFVLESSPQEAMVNLTGQYNVSGYSERDGLSVNIVINGRILGRGDRLDGLTITSIRPNRILLEGDDGVRYRIDYNP